MAKAEAAEQKAHGARDDAARELAWREAARQWERAADREKDDKRRHSYSEKADAARANADQPRAPDPDPDPGIESEASSTPRGKSLLLN